MRDALTGCIERALTPPERADQNRINRCWEMQEAETAIGLFLDDYTHLFSNEIKNFLEDVRTAVWNYEQEDEP